MLERADDAARQNNVTATNSVPSTNSQYGASAPLVNAVLAKFTSPAPSTGPMRVPRPPTATQITASMEFAGANSLGLMMPTCGT
jgi:hypothetical protein